MILQYPTPNSVERVESKTEYRFTKSLAHGIKYYKYTILQVNQIIKYLNN